MRQTTQIPISLKIDASLLDDLNKECELGYKRNRLINQAIAMFLEAREARRYDIVEDHGDGKPSLAVIRFIKKHLTPRAHVYLDNISYY